MIVATKEDPVAKPTIVADLSQLEENTRTRKTARAALPMLVVAARRDGWSWGAIAKAAGLSLQATRNVAREGNNGELPLPRQS